MSLDWSTLALQTINIVVLIWLLQRFLYRPVLRMVDARRAEIEETYRAAEAAKSAAEALHAAVETDRAGIAEERMAVLASAAEQAERAAASRLEAAAARGRALADEERARLGRERAAALAELHAMALDLGVGIAGRLLADVVADRRADLWLARIDGCLSRMTAAERAALTAAAPGAAVRVVTDQPLPESVRAEWRAHLQPALGADTKLEFDADADLIAGVELHAPGAVLCFSLRGARDAIRSEVAAA